MSESGKSDRDHLAALGLGDGGDAKGAVRMVAGILVIAVVVLAGRWAVVGRVAEGVVPREVATGGDGGFVAPPRTASDAFPGDIGGVVDIGGADGGGAVKPGLVLPGGREVAAVYVDESIPVFDPAGMYEHDASGLPAMVLGSCSGCHLPPQPDQLPLDVAGQDVWGEAVKMMYGMATEREMQLAGTADEVSAWYQGRAPEHLARLVEEDAGPGDVEWAPRGWRPANAPRSAAANPAVSHVAFVDVTGLEQDEILISDMRHGAVMLADPKDLGGNYLLVGRVKNPAGASVVDLDADGVKDIVVGDLGTFFPSNEQNGRVLWFRGVQSEGGQIAFDEVVLAEGMGRVSDVRGGDLDGDGDMDLAVAEFGWRTVGKIMWMENTGVGEDGLPAFEQHVIDGRAGGIHVPIVDLDGDGDLDIVSVFSQEHEQVMAYLREGDGYRAEVLFAAPNPSWGNTGIEPVDIDGDGDLDLLVTNGDAQDVVVPKPFHGVTILRNDGDLNFVPVRLTGMYGAHRALPADVDGDGDLDIVAAAFVPVYVMQNWRGGGMVGMLWMENKGDWEFERHELVQGNTDFATMAVGDFDKDGKPDVVLGGFSMGTGELDVLDSWVTILRNSGVPE